LWVLELKVFPGVGVFFAAAWDYVWAVYAKYFNRNSKKSQEKRAKKLAADFTEQKGLCGKDCGFFI